MAPFTIQSDPMVGIVFMEMKDVNTKLSDNYSWYNPSSECTIIRILESFQRSDLIKDQGTQKYNRINNL